MLLNPDMILLQREKQQRKRQGELLTLAAAITLEIIDPFYNLSLQVCWADRIAIQSPETYSCQMLKRCKCICLS